MTPIQIAYFKHFLFDKGIQKIYIYMYNRNRIKGEMDNMQENPESLEEFLQQQPHWRVIMHAFYFQPGSTYGHDFWKEINKQWLDYWDIHKDNFNNAKVATLKGTFGILRQNWDSPKYFEPESYEATYKRMNIEPPLPLEQIVPPESSTETTEPTESTPISPSYLEGFTLVETSSPGNDKMDQNIVSVNMRNRGYRITFSHKQSDLLKKGKYEYVTLHTNIETKEIAFNFTHQADNAVHFKRNDNKHNVSINSKNIVTHICMFYGINRTVTNYFQLEITDLVQLANSIIIKLKYNG